MTNSHQRYRLPYKDGNDDDPYTVNPVEEENFEDGVKDAKAQMRGEPVKN